MRNLTTAVKHLLIINIIIFVADFVLQMRDTFLAEQLGLRSLSSGFFKPWQPLTYMFMHAISHIFSLICMRCGFSAR